MSDDRFGIGGLISSWKTMLVLLCVTVPLGIWKMIDIIIWFIKNVHVEVG